MLHPFQFPERCRKFPGLTSATSIDWFLPWPEEALTSVSSALINDFDIQCDPGTKQHLINHMGAVHSKVVGVCADYFQQLRRNVYQTPKSYLSFIASYRGMYMSKLQEVVQMEQRVQIGLQKLVQGILYWNIPTG
jgi:dynein heavy chain